MSSQRERERIIGKRKVKTWQVLWREDGKQRSATFGSEPKALRFRSILDSDGAAAAYADAAKVATTETPPTLDEWIKRHVSDLTRATAGTKDRYLSMYARTFGPLLGRLELDVISRSMVAQAINRLAAEPRVSGKPLSSKSIANAHGLLSAALRGAVDARIITENPCAGLRLPQGVKHEHRILTHEEFGRLHEALPEHWRPLVVTLVGTGMRWGEVTALRVSDVDVVAQRIHVRQAWKQAPGGGRVIGTPKTPKSIRTIQLDPQQVVLDAIKPLLAGKKRTDYVFQTTTGKTPWSATFLADVWQPAIRRAGLDPEPRVHDLRHTAVAWAIAANVQLPTIQARLGHEKITTTIDTYGGLLPDVQTAAADASGMALERALRLQIGR